MKTVVFTGGIATGKSTALNYLRQIAPNLVFFDCDATVSALLDSGRLAPDLGKAFGPESVQTDGKANRAFLRDRIFSSPEDRKTLESLIHPEIREECLALQHDTVKNGRARGMIIDIPLFYEGGRDYGQDLVVVVSLPRPLQKQRLSLRNGFDDLTIDRILSSQLPLEEKEARADILLWNEGERSLLEAQIDLFYHHYFL